MVMSIIMTPPPLIFLLMIHGVYSSDDGWGVTYSSSHICAANDSTVTINCSYTYPTGYKIKEVFWTNTAVRGKDSPNLFKDSKYRERIQYLGDEQHDCSVRLTGVRHTDPHEYYFRFITHIDSGKWIGAPGVTLDVTDPPIPVVSISSSGVIVEGDSVNLTCSSESNPPVHIYSWFKGETSVGSGNIYIISNIRSDHSGQYKCTTRHACGDRESEDVILNVKYSPRNVSASISSSGVIVEGDSVTLTCSSESNPPVHNYSWFKEKTFVGSGNIYRISNITSGHSGEFKCKTSHTCGEKYSKSVTLNVLLHHSSNGLFGIIAACGGLLVISIIIVLILFMMSNRRIAKLEDAAVNQQDDQSHAIKHVDLASESANCDDAQYESVKPQRLRGEQTTAVEDPESRDPEELQYSTVHYKRNAEMRRSEDNENHYGNITNHKPDASVRSNEEDTSVIYSSVK